MPKALISDRGTHFYNKIMERTMKRYGVNHRFSTSYHPQTSGQVENTNTALKRILEKTIKDNPTIWSRELDDALYFSLKIWKIMKYAQDSSTAAIHFSMPREETYHWGLKRQKFYGYASNMESSYDVYSRYMIIVVTSLKIMKWYGYSHLEEIIVRRQDDKLYKFREGDFKRLRRQDIEDMLLLLDQDKLTNLNLEEQYALNVALRMFTRHLRRMTSYTAYPDIQGITYEDELNRKRLMRTDELHKFSNGTLCNNPSFTTRTTIANSMS
ncbi:copia protein [Tanacetum coccineum]